MGLALSTSWNASRCKNAEELLFEIEALGFKEIELSFNLEESTVKDIEKRASERQLKVVSLHNFCPIPQGIKKEAALPDFYSMSSLDRDERKNAVKYTKISIDTALRAGAKALVLHCGRVVLKDKTKELISLFREGKSGTRLFKEAREKAVEERKALAGPFFENTLRSLKEINQYAEEKNILLGIETRFYYGEIPSFEEIAVILDAFKDSNIGYWHDTGHAQVMQDLGFKKHLDYLKAYGKKMIGLHLHDVFKCQDHLAPFKGEFNFNLLRPYLKKGALKVIEAHQPATSSDLKESKKILETFFDNNG